jgi:type IV secretory pathway component VirB8
MIANSAFLAAMVLMLVTFFVAGELSFLAPYKAVVEFDKVYTGYGNRLERSRETDVAQITFVLRGQIANAVIPVNPLGLTITYFRVDQAFK